MAEYWEFLGEDPAVTLIRGHSRRSYLNRVLVSRPSSSLYIPVSFRPKNLSFPSLRLRSGMLFQRRVRNPAEKNSPFDKGEAVKK
jgi:hypothetical protein